MKIRSVGDELFHAVRRTDMTKLIFAFRNFTKRGEILNKHDTVPSVHSSSVISKILHIKIQKTIILCLVVDFVFSVKRNIHGGYLRGKFGGEYLDIKK
jgi:hypothetical protein